MSKIVSTTRREQMLRVARLYYIDGVEQNRIAEREGISRPTVSRLLTMARDKGLVSITVNDDLRDAQLLADQLEEQYVGVQFTVVSTAQNRHDEKVAKISTATANYLNQVVKSGDIIGLGWGKELYETAQHLSQKRVRDVEVLSLTGVFTYPKYRTYVAETAGLFADAYQTAPQMLPLPIVFDDVKNKKVVEKEHLLQYLQKLSRVSNVAIFTINTVAESPFLQEMNYFTDAEKKQVTAKAKGDILSHFIDENGDVVDADLDARTVSIPLSNLKFKEHAIAIVDKPEKVSVLAIALKAGYVNEVFIDQQSAQVLLDI